MSAARGRLAVLMSLALAATSCLPTGDFRCDKNTQCGAHGSCEIDGRCSAPDPKCPTGRRYLEQEGDASRLCVGDTCKDNRLVEITAGLEHACARRAEGGVSCWGRNDDGQLGDGSRTPRALAVTVAGIEDAISISAGERHTCAVTSAGTVLCWGADDAGQLGDGAGQPSRATPTAVGGLAPAVAVSAGQGFSCAILRDGTARCWGDNTSGQLGDGGAATAGQLPTTVFALGGIRALSGRSQHTCALRDDETVWCWGANGSGQLGDGSSIGRRQPVEVQGLSAVTQIATGSVHTCAATRAAGLFCWGGNLSGQLGSEDAPTLPLPTAVPIVTDPVAVTAGGAHTCAIRQGGATLCWGANVDGQLGEGSTSTLPIPAPVRDLGSSAGVVAGGAFTCALDAHGALFCWGDDHYGQLGLGRTVVRARPASVTLAAGGGALRDAVDLTSGGEHACVSTAALDVPKQVVCWGANQAGQLGDATTIDRAAGAPVKGNFDAVSVAAGLAHTCALDNGGGLWCWGRGGDGQLGPPHKLDASSPAHVALNGTAHAVAAGDLHTCVALDDHSARCWGANHDGQLGDGTTLDHLMPTVVSAVADASLATLDAVDDIVAGAAHTCAIRLDGSLRCWGRGAEGQLGDGAAMTRTLPVALTLGPNPPGALASAISAGRTHTCSIDRGGDVWCWGDGVLAPVAVMTLHEARGVAAGGAHTCSIAADKTVLCWGANDSGQLGAEGPAALVPTAVPGLTDVEQLAAGGTYTCARLHDRTVWCWGGNTAGQLGDGDALSQPLPQLARLACH